MLINAMIRLLHPIAVQLLILLLIAISLIIVAGQVLMTDPIRPSFLQYIRYLPGELRPETGCEDAWDHWTINYGDFSCVFHERDSIHVYGNGTVITGTFITFTDARAGDVLAFLGAPQQRQTWMSRRSRSRFYLWQGVQVYLYRPMNLQERMRYLSFWKPLPT